MGMETAGRGFALDLLHSVLRFLLAARAFHLNGEPLVGITGKVIDGWEFLVGYIPFAGAARSLAPYKAIIVHWRRIITQYFLCISLLLGASVLRASAQGKPCQSRVVPGFRTQPTFPA